MRQGRVRTVGSVVLEDVDEAHRILDDAAPVQRILAKMGRACGTCPLWEGRQRQWKNEVGAMIANAMGWRS